jgi:hypothetical protein
VRTEVTEARIRVEPKSRPLQQPVPTPERGITPKTCC